MPNLVSQLPQRLPLFLGLKPVEMKLFLNICKMTTAAPGDVLCEYGTASRRFYILLEGELDILGKDGTSVARVPPVTTVGEMGFINKKPRAATVRAIKRCQLLRIESPDFESLLEANHELRSKLYRNTIRVLSDRLSDANDMITRYKKLSGATVVAATDEAETDRVEEEPAYSAGEIGEAGGAAQAASEGADRRPFGPHTSDQSAPDSAPSEDLIRSFYELAEEIVDDAQLARDCDDLAALRDDGYSDVDIEYAVKWTARNIPTARRFTMVKLSIEEAFKDRWTV